MYDLIILGGGPAGYRAAEKAAGSGMSVLLFEEAEVGGVCLNEGCIPTKTLLHSAKLYESALEGSRYGVHADAVCFKYAEAAIRKDRVVRKLRLGVESSLKAAGVELCRERGVIEGKKADSFLVNGRQGRRLLIATGSESVLPRIRGIERAITSREALSLTEAPERVAIIGAGAVGLEFAALFCTAGSRVSVYELTGRIAAGFDYELSELLRKSYEKRGIEIHLKSELKDIGELDSECVLVAAGRRARTEGLGLESVGLSCIETNSRMETGVAGIYAAGDCNGKSMLAHTAVREAEAAVNNMLGREDEVSYRAVPSVIYTQPELAGVGLTRESAAGSGMEVTERKLSLRYNGRFVAENERGEGYCKLVEAEGRIVGAHILGGPASEIIAAAVLAVEQALSPEEFSRMIFPHPSVSEILRDTAVLRV